MSKGLYSYNTKEWQPLVGCRNDLPCWRNCWAHKSVRRIVRCQEKGHPERADFFRQFVTEKGWSGKVALDKKHLLDPLKWRQPQIVASGYHGDWALLSINDIERVLRTACGALRRGHKFLFLTKRPELLAEKITPAMNRIYGFYWAPPEGLFIGASIMTQTDADQMLPYLARLAAAGWRTWVSIEPMVAAITYWRIPWPDHLYGSLLLDVLTGTLHHGDKLVGINGPRLSWVVLGGESGPNARPMAPEWARSVRDQCQAAGVPYYFKQWGEWAPTRGTVETDYIDHPVGDGTHRRMFRVGAKAAGHLLDGQRVQQYPTELARIAEGRP